MSATAAATTATAIDENRRRAIAAVLPDAELATVHQVHSARRVYVDRAWPQDERPHADAMVTDRPDCCSASSPPIARRSCSPIPKAGVVGAAHAGWRGAFAGVTEATIDAMEQLGARRERYRRRGRPVHRAADPTKWTKRSASASSTQDPANDRFFTSGPRASRIST